MPFFNFRRGNTSAATLQAAVPESADALRRRARHRLIGSAVLVLAGVIGFPLVFDTQPRPLAVDVAIEIPGKTTAKPLVLPAPVISASVPAVVATPALPASAPVTPASRVVSEKVAAAASLTAEEEIVPSKPAPVSTSKASAATKSEAKTVLPPSTRPALKTEAKTEARTEAKTDSRPAAADEGARARALLNGTAMPPLADTSAVSEAGESSERFIVQVGAFADVAKAREARLKLEGAGLKTYTQMAQTADGKRIRVRVGPFATRAAADKAASKIKTLGLSAAILTL